MNEYATVTIGMTTTMKFDPHQVKPYLNLPDNYDPVKAEKHNNGCGPSGWKGKLIPETNYGIRISDSCHVHDFEYGEKVPYSLLACVPNIPPFKFFDKIVKNHIRKLQKEGYVYLDGRQVADLRMWSNHLLIIKKEAKWSRFLNVLRRQRAKTYYFFVDKMGSKHFKN